MRLSSGSDDKIVFLCHSYSCGSPACEGSATDGAERAAAPGVVHIDVGALWRDDEAALQNHSDTHFSEFQRHFSLSSCPLCRRTSRRSLSYSNFLGIFRCLLVFVSVPLTGMTPLESLLFSVFVVGCSLRRCVRKQTAAAPILQLHHVVWSEESFFWLHEEPNHQNTRICWVTIDLSSSQLP